MAQRGASREALCRDDDALRSAFVGGRPHDLAGHTDSHVRRRGLAHQRGNIAARCRHSRGRRLPLGADTHSSRRDLVAHSKLRTSRANTKDNLKLYHSRRRSGFHLHFLQQHRVPASFSPTSQISLQAGAVVVVCGRPPEVRLQGASHHLLTTELETREKATGVVDGDQQLSSRDEDGSITVGDLRRLACISRQSRAQSHHLWLVTFQGPLLPRFLMATRDAPMRLPPPR
mmetsp:Transcript_19422/g.67661  ORF Transcript_19422/g.67661 Transcript_19422/m.67661 type:complete len:230 (+) Transcript_19422:1304-1993(+)